MLNDGELERLIAEDREKTLAHERAEFEVAVKLSKLEQAVETAKGNMHRAGALRVEGKVTKSCHRESVRVYMACVDALQKARADV